MSLFPGYGMSTIQKAFEQQGKNRAAILPSPSMCRHQALFRGVRLQGSLHVRLCEHGDQRHCTDAAFTLRLRANAVGAGAHMQRRLMDAWHCFMSAWHCSMMHGTTSWVHGTAEWMHGFAEWMLGPHSTALVCMALLDACSQGHCRCGETSSGCCTA